MGEQVFLLRHFEMSRIVAKTSNENENRIFVSLFLVSDHSLGVFAGLSDLG